MRRRNVLPATAALLAACTGIEWRDAPPAVPREFRGAWVATVANIDWPSRPGLSEAAQRAEIAACVRLAADSGLNALLLQLRSVGDAFYPSQLAPWSAALSGESGRGPGYDPLAAWLAETRAAGLELHAWINPLRVAHPEMPQAPAASHVTRTHPEWVRAVGRFQWLDPGEPAVRQHVVAVVRELLAAYPLDGLHIDDYFYPYPEDGVAFPDDATFAAARSRGEAGDDRDAWRRGNVDALVAAMADAVHATRPSALFGISPFGIGRTEGRPAGIEGFDPWAQLHADAETWWTRGLVDAMSPQLYWPRTRPAQSFDVLLDHWAGLAPRHGHLWPSLNDEAAAVPAPGWADDEIEVQVHATRARRRAGGNVHFSLTSLAHATPALGARLREGVYAQPALTPPSPWRPAPSCAPPRLHGQRAGDRATLALHVEPGTTHRAAVWTRTGAEDWRLHLCPLDLAGDGVVTLDASAATPLRAVAHAVAANGTLGHPSELRW